MGSEVFVVFRVVCENSNFVLRKQLYFFSRPVRLAGADFLFTFEGSVAFFPLGLCEQWLCFLWSVRAVAESPSFLRTVAVFPFTCWGTAVFPWIVEQFCHPFCLWSGRCFDT